MKPLKRPARLLDIALFAILGCLIPRLATAQSSAAALTLAARAQLDSLNADSATTLLVSALDPRTGATPTERVRALVLLGISELIANRLAEARRVLQQALTLDPTIQVDSLAFLHSSLLDVFGAERDSIVRTERRPPAANTSSMAADFSGLGVEGGVARGITTGPVVRTDQVYLEPVVEERPELISHPPVHYPEILKQAGIDGHVVVEAIIDTTGHVERGSIKILSSTNQLFEQPSKEVVAASVYRPGKISGRAVRVRVQVPLNFAVTRGGLGGP